MIYTYWAVSVVALIITIGSFLFFSNTRKPIFKRISLIALVITVIFAILSVITLSRITGH